MLPVSPFERRLLMLPGLARLLSSSNASPKELNTLKPLYSGGLWLAVIITPQSRFRALVSQDKAGVGRKPKSLSSAPVSRAVLVRTAFNSAPDHRESCPIASLLPRPIVTLRASSRATDGFTLRGYFPRMPELPKRSVNPYF